MECGGFEARRQISKTPHPDDLSCSSLILGVLFRASAVLGSSDLKRCRSWLRTTVATGHGGLNESGGGCG